MVTFIGTAHDIHPNMKCNKGGYISLGPGVMHAISTIQNSNTGSTQEYELAGIS